ncbi:hypothetical protein ABIB68_008180 [Bradyrhizobium sp. F1.2.2]
MVLEGKYRMRFLAYAGADAPTFTPEELKIIGAPRDFVGLSPRRCVIASFEQRM